MKNVFTLFVSLLSVFYIVAQKPIKESLSKKEKAEKLLSTKIEIDVNTEMFTPVAINTYVSEKPKGLIMTLIVPESYQKAKETLNNKISEEIVVTEQGEKTVNGITFLYVNGYTESEGKKLSSTIYCVKYNKESCLMFMGMIDEDATTKHKNAIANAAISIVKNYEN